MAKSAPATPARDRLLAAANELFYAEGIHCVGIDRVIEQAGVAKATLYHAFGSKEELIKAYLQVRFESRRRRVERNIAAHEDAREQMLAVFDGLAEMMSDPAYRGCPFINAGAEVQAEDPVALAVAESRSWFKEMFHTLAVEAGAEDPDRLADMLVLLYDGASVSAKLDHDRSAAKVARESAVILIDSATNRT